MAKKDENGDLRRPPYLPFKTVKGFIQKLKDTAVPERVDSSLLRTYSGSTARKLTLAIKFLGLIEENGKTTEKLVRLAKALGTPEWQLALSSTMHDAYKDVIGNLNLEVATPAQLEEKLKARGAEGAVLQTSVGFYVSAMRDAGVALSPHILSKPRAKGERGRGRTKRERQETGEGEGVNETPSLAGGTIRFAFPIPEKQAATIFLPGDLTLEDWEMVSAMVKAYIERRKKA